MTGVGYTFRFSKTALSFELQFKNARRNGTVTDLGDGIKFKTGQIGETLFYHFKMTIDNSQILFKRAGKQWQNGNIMRGG